MPFSFEMLSRYGGNISKEKGRKGLVTLKLLKRTYTKTELVGLVAIVFGVGLCLDVLFGNFHFFSIIFPALLLFIGQRQRKKRKTVAGNILLLMGVLILAGTLLTSIAFQLAMITLMIYYGYHLYKSPSRKKKVDVKIEPSSAEDEPREFVQVEPFFKNMLVGEIRNMDGVYELDDIDIQYGFGDVHIDLSYTMIPEGETVILIRGMVGSVHLYVPYDVELSIHTSALFGKVSLLDKSSSVFNTTQKFQTKEYKTATRKIKIVTSLLIGDIEVRNV